MGRYTCRMPTAFRNKTTGEKVHAACGQCVNCILKDKAVWAGRALIEWNEAGRVGSFVTLTYRDEPEPDRYPDVRSFLERLWQVRTLRFYCAPDIGGQNGRFHWHLLLFGLEANPTNTVLIEDSWKLGFVDVRPIIAERVSYTTGYVTRKKTLNFPYHHRQSQRFGKSFFLRKGAELASAARPVTVCPGLVNVDGKRYPIHRTCKRWLKEGFEDAGGVGWRAYPIDREGAIIENVLNYERLGAGVAALAELKRLQKEAMLK